MPEFQYLVNEWVTCRHPGCKRRAVKFVGNSDTGNTLGQSHDCCTVHCREH